MRLPAKTCDFFPHHACLLQDLEYIVTTADQLLQEEHEEQLMTIRATKAAMRKRIDLTMAGVIKTIASHPKAQSKPKSVRDKRKTSEEVANSVLPLEKMPVARPKRRPKMILAKADWGKMLDEQQEQLLEVDRCAEEGQVWASLLVS